MYAWKLALRQGDYRLVTCARRLATLTRPIVTRTYRMYHSLFSWSGCGRCENVVWRRDFVWLDGVMVGFESLPSTTESWGFRGLLSLPS